MDSLDGVLLARIQFAANITFHILFPTISIALGWALLTLRLAWLRSRSPHWLLAYRFWTKVFALTFALGVVSGIVMSFQFGTNWPGFMQRVGNVAGPLLGYEVLTAFFLEATFLGIMLFGHGRVSERVHLVATFLVAFGTTMSAFWIIALNSWMQTPAGYEIVDGRFQVTSWYEVLFNPSMPYRLTHMLLASFLTVAFLIAGISAWQLLRGKDNPSTRPVLRASLGAAAALIPLQIFMGDLHGLNTLEHQPAKVAAMEALWKSQRGAPLVLVAWPDMATQSNRFAVEIPHGAALILRHQVDGELKGIDAFPGAHPPVAPLFWSFRIMVGTGVLMLVSSWTGVIWMWRQRRRNTPLTPPRWLLMGLVAMTFSGWLATVAGWYVTEVGRQPFLVYGYLKTAEAASNVAPANIALTLTAYLIVYVLLIAAYISVLRHMAEKPTEDLGTPARTPSQASAATAAGGE
ncbi:MAG TPA: cytochrome ubiquinol oxidase subunit I [Burkholderiaceae bacterium]|nr:cytochrome ubiquinol oxidase subunit I [Burkholderiaceae bacterium]HQR69560.1 cytochrome ubiquinol oxidase subunit I [Burkholderiaceae bacterium]